LTYINKLPSIKKDQTAAAAAAAAAAATGGGGASARGAGVEAVPAAAAFVWCFWVDVAVAVAAVAPGVGGVVVSSQLSKRSFRQNGLNFDRIVLGRSRELEGPLEVYCRHRRIFTSLP
jgi:hypothetical protein